MLVSWRAPSGLLVVVVLVVVVLVVVVVAVVMVVVMRPQPMSQFGGLRLHSL